MAGSLTAKDPGRSPFDEQTPPATRTVQRGSWASADTLCTHKANLDRRLSLDRPVHPAALLLPSMTNDEYCELVADIAQHGQRQPVIIDQHGQVIDGAQRLLACRDLSIEPEIQVLTLADPVAAVMSLNLTRRHLTQSQRAAIAVELLPLLEAEAHERRKASLKQYRDTDRATSPTRTGEDVHTARSRDRVAQLTGSSGRYVQDAKRVQQCDPEAFAAIKRGVLTVNSAKERFAHSPKPRPARTHGKARETIQHSDRPEAEQVISSNRLRSTWIALIELALGAREQNVLVSGEVRIMNDDRSKVLLRLGSVTRDGRTRKETATSRSR